MKMFAGSYSSWFLSAKFISCMIEVFWCSKLLKNIQPSLLYGLNNDSLCLYQVETVKYECSDSCLSVKREFAEFHRAGESQGKPFRQQHFTIRCHSHIFVWLQRLGEDVTDFCLSCHDILSLTEIY